MGIFRFIWKTTKAISRTTFYLGSIYSLFAYFYVEQIKYRLKDSEHTSKIVSQRVKEYANSLKSNPNDQTDPFALSCLGIVQKVSAFYSRAWNYRQYERLCLRFHKNVIKTVLKNYESYGILKHKAQMNKSIETNKFNPVLMKKILEVKQANQQLMMGSVDQYRQIIQKQVLMQTGSIIGLAQSQAKDIDLIYKYLQKGLYLMTSGDHKYWQHKLFVSQFRQHSFNDVIFELAFI